MNEERQEDMVTGVWLTIAVIVASLLLF